MKTKEQKKHTSIGALVACLACAEALFNELFINALRQRPPDNQSDRSRVCPPEEIPLFAASVRLIAGVIPAALLLNDGNWARGLVVAVSVRLARCAVQLLVGLQSLVEHVSV